MAILKLWYLVIFLSVVLIVSADKSKKQLSGETNTQLKAIQTLLDSKNGAPLARGANNIARDSTDFEQELENLFEQVFNGKWENAALLFQFARLTPDASVKLIIYKVLWRQMQITGMSRNPLKTLELYVELQENLAYIYTTSLNAAEQQIYVQLQQEIRDALIERSAQILEAPFHATNTNCSCEFPKLEELLVAIAPFGDMLFGQIFDMIYDNIADIETPLHIAQTLATFPPMIWQNVVANLNYTKKVDFDAPGGQLVNATLRDNFWNLKKKQEFSYLSIKLQNQVDEFLGLNQRVWELPQLICIRNATNDLYLYKTLNSSYIGTQPKSLDREIFRVRFDAFINFRFRSVDDDNYITMNDYNSTIMPAVAKNVISGRGSYWVVLEASGNLVYFLNVERNYYLCAGSLDFYEDGNIYAYTRRSDTVQEYQNECQWIIEDCE